MTRLKELERRLRDEPDNLGLRVMVAGALHDAGRRDEAIELYRSVAIAYREQGRPQQAITVCRSILELAPHDAACSELLSALLASQVPEAPERRSPSASYRPSPAPGASRPSPPRLPRPPSPEPHHRADPERRSSGRVTPLPEPLPYHVADPTVSSQPRLRRSDLPPSLQEELASYPEIAGIANAARQISASLIAASRQEDEDDLAGDLDTTKFPRRTLDELDLLLQPPPPLEPPPLEPPPFETVEQVTQELGEDDPTLPPRSSEATDAILDERSDERTEPREQPARLRPPSIAQASTATGPLASELLAPVPPHNRSAVLQRFRRRMAASRMTVIRRGETGHGLVLVVRGRLELQVERDDGSSLVVGSIAPGEYVGEASLLARSPASVDVVAAVESELLVLAAPDFYEVTGAFPALWAALEIVAEQRAREHALLT
jgi:hypothetical protein